MKGRVIDGIVWLAVGVSLIGQAAFLVAWCWWPAERSAPPDWVPPPVAGAIVAIGFVTVGLGAFGIGVRRLLTAWRLR